MRLIIDLSSIGKTGLYEGKDQEFGVEVEHEGKPVWVNGWQHGFERFTGYVIEVMKRFNIQPHNVVMVTDGKNSKERRKAIYPPYNSKRTSRPPETRVQFELMQAEITTQFRAIGCHFVTQDGVEADDVIGYLCQELTSDCAILSNDGDMAALLSDRVSLIVKGTLVTDNPLGPFSPKYITLYKALVGDTADTIKGAFNFGKKSFLDFLVWQDEQGLAALEGMVKRRTLHELVEDVPDFKPLQRIVDDAAEVYKCYEVAKIHPDWCNKVRQPLQWQAGMVRGRDVVLDERLRPFCQSVRLITAANYEQAMKFLAEKLRDSPIVALDIETATPELSDQWLAERGTPDKVDVFGSLLTGQGLTFGNNSQFTFYFCVNHAETQNVTSDQVRAAVELIPQTCPIVVQNASFELPILYEAWGEDMKDNGWHGFLPNVIDTKQMASYVDENQSLGLKKLSAHYLDYKQTEYLEVTTSEGEVGTLRAGGQQTKAWEIPLTREVTKEVVDKETGEITLVTTKENVVDAEGNVVIAKHMEQRSYKMNELSGEHVLSYGADDTICTAALFHFFKMIMEMEKTWDVFMEVEQLPAYLTALAFHQGTKFDLGAMQKMAAEDQATWEEHAAVLREFLFKIEWPGTKCPVYTLPLAPKDVKEIVEIVLGHKLDTQVRTISKLAKLVELVEHDEAASLADMIAKDQVDQINKWVAMRFTGEANLDTDSPTQMKKFLYDTCGFPVRIVGSCTPLERKNKPELAGAVSRYKRIWAGSTTEMPLMESEKELIKAKAKTNEIAIAFALEMDQDNENIYVLDHIQKMKKCETRRKLYYETYSNIRHWKDRKIHAQVNQNGTITRRYSSSDPNLQQLPKKGEGVKFRKCFLPHHKDAVVCSVDFAGQELRQGAGMSGDVNMLACFVGDNLKDMHSMTAAGAMEKKWGKSKLTALIENFGQTGDSADMYDLYLRLRKMKDQPEIAKMADDLRKNAKNVNFGAQYDAMAPKLAETLIIPVADAQAFLDAKFAMFPRFEEWKEEVKNQASELGYVTTCMGARRHLRESLISQEWGVADKALRQGPNFKIQGSSAEQTKLAMARLWKSGILHRLDMVFFAPIHDELCWSVHKDHAAESCRIVNECMTVPYGNLPVPFLGSISLGKTFGDQIECGDVFDEAAINEALASIFEVKNETSLA
jgi:5'-3' exonuclease